MVKVRKKSVRKTNSTDIHLLVSPESKEEYFQWDRSKIAEALIIEAQLNKKIANDIAKSVEEKVFKSGIHRISSALIRELVDNELFERGYQKKLAKQVTIGMPKHDIEELIYSKSSENSNISSDVGLRGGFKVAYSESV